ncbi:MAG: hypothetical protein K6G00_04035 [Treponema sp.]|nr:hypothetical protein [Treponema sp.]
MKLRRLFYLVVALCCMLFVTCASTKQSGSSGKDRGSSDSSATAGGSSKDSSKSGSSSSSKSGSSSSSKSGSSSSSDSDSSSSSDSDSSSKSGKGSQSDSSSGKKYSSDNQINSLIDSIENSRRNAENAGGDSALSDLYNAANDAFERLKQRAAAGENTPELKRALENLNSLFKGLEVYAEAKAKKERIDEKGYAYNNQNAYDEGASLLEELEEMNKNAAAFIAELEKGTSDNGNEFLKKANKADLDFSNVFKTTATNERSAAFKAKKQADSVKASVSRKNDYDNGVASFRNGDSKYVTGDIEGSIEDYVSARGIFSKLYKEVSAARKKAQTLIDDAKNRVKHSESVALKADKTDPLTEKIQGIEDENAILLESDDFSAAKATYVEIDEKIEVGGGASL